MKNLKSFTSKIFFYTGSAQKYMEKTTSIQSKNLKNNSKSNQKTPLTYNVEKFNHIEFILNFSHIRF